MTEAEAVLRTGIDAAALKPSECTVESARDLPFETVTIDYEGREHLPDFDAVARLAREMDVKVTVPVRADGFDPLGDDDLYRSLPEAAGVVAVAGHPAYLSGEERRRAIAPRLRALLDDGAPDAWVGTEGIERLALATDATQFELLSGTTEADVRALRDAGFAGTVAVYAPTVLSDDDDAVLDAVGAYAARRGPIARRLPEGAATDGDASGRAREVLLAGCRDVAIAGDADDVRARVESLKDAGVDRVVAYPARGVEEFAAGP